MYWGPYGVIEQICKNRTNLFLGRTEIHGDTQKFSRCDAPIGILSAQWAEIVQNLEQIEQRFLRAHRDYIFRSHRNTQKYTEILVSVRRTELGPYGVIEQIYKNLAKVFKGARVSPSVGTPRACKGEG